MAIRGGSAGGMTALNALAAGEGFAACASWYGVTDLIGARRDDPRLRGALHGPADRPAAQARGRSTRSGRRCNRAGSMTGSVLLLQGTEDPVVPPAQAETHARALDAAGTRVRPALFRRRGARFPAGGHPDRMPRGRAGLLPRGAPPLERSPDREGAFPGAPRVRGFRDAMPTNSATTIPSSGRPGRRPVAAGPGPGQPDLAGGRRRAAVPGAAPCSRCSRSTRRPTRCTRCGGAWRSRRSPSARWRRPCWPGWCARARRRQPGPRPDEARSTGAPG